MKESFLSVGNSMRKKKRLDAHSPSLCSILAAHCKIIFLHYIFFHLKIPQFLSVSVTKCWVFHIVENKKQRLFTKVRQDTPGVHFSSPYSQIRQRNGVVLTLHRHRNSLEFHTFPERKPEIMHGDIAGNRIKQIAHSNHQIRMCESENKLNAAQFQSLIIEKAIQGINVSICLLIAKEGVYFAKFVTNKQTKKSLKTYLRNFKWSYFSLGISQILSYFYF